MWWTRFQRTLRVRRARRAHYLKQIMLFNYQSAERTIVGAMAQNYRPLPPAFIGGRVRHQRFSFTVPAGGISTAKTVELCVIPKGAILIDGKFAVYVGGTTPDITLGVVATAFALADSTNVAWELLNPDTLEWASNKTNNDLYSGAAGVILTASGIAANTMYSFGAYPDLIANFNANFRSSPFTREMFLYLSIGDAAAGTVQGGYINYVVD